MAKLDITKGEFLTWNQFADTPTAEVLPVIYQHATVASHQARAWYWTSIKAKKRASMIFRVLGFACAVVGVATPLIAAAVERSECRLWLTQAGVVALALAGVSQLGDRVFGWSSGWLRYVTTVTGMEKITLQFELDWAEHFVEKGGSATQEDKKALFDLARDFEVELKKRQSDETDGWVAEFNSGTAALNEMIKSQREATEKAADVAQTAVDAQKQGRKQGAVQVSIVQGAPAKAARVIFNGKEEPPFIGPSWAKLDVEPGVYSLRVVLADNTQADQVVEVAGGTTARVEVKF